MICPFLEISSTWRNLYQDSNVHLNMAKIEASKELLELVKLESTARGITIQAFVDQALRRAISQQTYDYLASFQKRDVHEQVRSEDVNPVEDVKTTVQSEDVHLNKDEGLDIEDESSESESELSSVDPEMFSDEQRSYILLVRIFSYWNIDYEPVARDITQGLGFSQTSKYLAQYDVKPTNRKFSKAKLEIKVKKAFLKLHKELEEKGLLENALFFLRNYQG